MHFDHVHKAHCVGELSFPSVVFSAWVYAALFALLSSDIFGVGVLCRC